MKYFIQTYINNKNYHSITYQKTFPVNMDNSVFKNFTNMEELQKDISFENFESDNVPYYIFFKYDNIEEYNQLVNLFEKNKIIPIENFNIYNNKKNEKIMVISINE